MGVKPNSSKYISFNLTELSSSVNYATVEHILRANKVLKMPKSNQSAFSCMENLSQCKLLVEWCFIQ